jgi:hypothetical protein
MNWWFIVQIDRDFITGVYGDGYRLYREDKPTYDIVVGKQYDNNKLIVETDSGEIVELDYEPNSEQFNNLLHNPWKEWDKLHGNHPFYKEDRTDYKPWFAKTIKESAEWLSLT